MTKKELANFILDEMAGDVGGGCYVWDSDDDCKRVCIDGWFNVALLAERILEKMK